MYTVHVICSRYLHMYSLYTVCDLKVHTSASIIISWACVGTAGSFLKLIQRHALIVYGSTVDVMFMSARWGSSPLCHNLIMKASRPIASAEKSGREG